jgi:hypothetical protein
MKKEHENIAISLAMEWRELNRSWEYDLKHGMPPDYAKEIHESIVAKAKETDKPVVSIRLIFYNFYTLWPEQYCSELTGVKIKSRVMSAVERTYRMVSTSIIPDIIGPRDYFPPNSSNMLTTPVVALDPYDNQIIRTAPITSTSPWARNNSNYHHTPYKTPQEEAWERFNKMVNDAKKR